MTTRFPQSRRRPYIPPIGFALLALVAFPAHSHAVDRNSGPGSEAKPILWPDAPRPRTVVKPITTFFDGYPVSILSLQTREATLEVMKSDPFSQVPAGSSRYSLELVSPTWPNVYFGLSYFDRGEFLPDLSEASWQSYKLGLAQERPDARVVFESSNIESPATPYVLGSHFRQIAYEIPNGAETAKKREIFAFVGSDLLVISITGLKADVDQSWTKLDQFISEMSLGQ